MAKQVFQIFLCILDREEITCLPLCFYPTKKANATEVKNIFSDVSNKLNEISKRFVVEMTITDGFLNPNFKLTGEDIQSRSEGDAKEEKCKE